MEVKINFRGINLVVNGNYTPEEPMIMYYSEGDGYPGAGSEYEILEIYVEDSSIDIFELFSFSDIEEIEELCLTEIEN